MTTKEKRKPLWGYSQVVELRAQSAPLIWKMADPPEVRSITVEMNKLNLNPASGDSELSSSSEEEDEKGNISF
jgi:hypothetical protein